MKKSLFTIIAILAIMVFAITACSKKKQVNPAAAGSNRQASYQATMTSGYEDAGIMETDHPIFLKSANHYKDELELCYKEGFGCKRSYVLRPDIPPDLMELYKEFLLAITDGKVREFYLEGNGQRVFPVEDNILSDILTGKTTIVKKPQHGLLGTFIFRDVEAPAGR